jgi:hypothetical protein
MVVEAFWFWYWVYVIEEEIASSTFNLDSTVQLGDRRWGSGVSGNRSNVGGNPE